MICLVCKHNPAIKHPTFGFLPCLDCQQRTKRKSVVELIPERIKDDRKKHKDHTIQPFRKGFLSKEYVEQYGTKHIDVTPEEVKKAKRVWTENEYYNE